MSIISSFVPEDAVTTSISRQERCLKGKEHQRERARITRPNQEHRAQKASGEAINSEIKLACKLARIYSARNFMTPEERLSSGVQQLAVFHRYFRLICLTSHCYSRTLRERTHQFTKNDVIRHFPTIITVSGYPNSHRQRGDGRTSYIRYWYQLAGDPNFSAAPYCTRYDPIHLLAALPLPGVIITPSEHKRSTFSIKQVLQLLSVVIFLSLTIHN